jgi:hypothetical protein
MGFLLLLGNAANRLSVIKTRYAACNFGAERTLPG